VRINVFNLKSARFYIGLLIGLVFGSTILSFIGDLSEQVIRNIYRESICKCDTLRIKNLIDNYGVPYINYYSVPGFHIGKKQNPVDVCFKAEAYYQEHSDSSKLKFKNCLDALSEMEVIRDSALFFEYNYNWLYKMNAPWVSAMAQAFVLKTYVNAFEVFGDSIYLKKSRLILNSFIVDIEKGGVRNKLSENQYWYEEYPNVEGDSPFILNGMLYSLDGLWYYYQKTGDLKSKQIYDNGINAVLELLKNYDNTEKSFYDLKGMVATDYYHKIHIDLLYQVYRQTNISTFKEFADKWNKYEEFTFLEKLIQEPNKASILISFVVYFFSWIISVVLIYKFWRSPLL
jgi:hypothetical protein